MLKQANDAHERAMATHRDCVSERRKAVSAAQRLGWRESMREAWNLRVTEEDRRQLAAPWYDKEFWVLRHKESVRSFV